MRRFLKSKFLFSVYILAFVASLTVIYRDSFKRRTAPTALKGAEAGVLFYDRWRASDGYNVVNTYFEQLSCVVYTMNGEVVFRFPGGFCHFLSSGEFFTIAHNINFYNSSGRLVWKATEDMLHHDVSLSPDEREIFLLSGEIKTEGGKKIRMDAVRGYSLKGEKIFEWRETSDYLDMVKKQFPEIPLVPAQSTNTLFEYSRFNSVQVLPKNDLEDKIPAFARGNILINDFRFPMMFILDRDSKRIIWTHVVSRTEWEGAHTVRLSKKGIISYFGNVRAETKTSMLAEFDPLLNKITWVYQPKPLSLLVMPDYGSAYKLPNGNTLATHNTFGGSAFEVTPRGRVVWEWVYPVRNGKNELEPIYQVQRVPKDRIDKVLKVWKFN